MATIVLGTVGQIFAGPIGGLLGTAIGGAIDRSVLGGNSKSREAGRISNPALQSSAYGEPIPIIVGRMRTAGNLIWSNEIVERSSSAGAGKRSGPATTTYNYTASFAVGLVAGRITAIGRIWADGKIIRTGDGIFLTPIVMRLHDGGPDQSIDPLIAAAQGLSGTPAFRGLAYAVFEDMPLAEFGNRIPNLTFEILADAQTIDAGKAMARIAALAGYQGLTVTGSFPRLSGHIVGRGGSLAEGLAPLLAMSDGAITADGGLAIVTPAGNDKNVPAGIGDARRPGDNRSAERLRRAAADTQPGNLELAFYNSDRDYQPGLARVRRSSRPGVDQRSIATAMMPGDARQLAISLLATGEAARLEQTIRLPWRWLAMAPGDSITIGESPDLWRVRERRFENFVVHLDLVRVVATVPARAGGTSLVPEILLSEPAGAGDFRDPASAKPPMPIGPTQLHVLDLPALPGALTDMPRLWVAANGGSGPWRRTGVAVSLDGGTRYSNIGAIADGTIMGIVSVALPPGSACIWDRHGVIDVELLTDRDWLEGRSKAQVLAGANLALIGDELVQFSDVEALAPRRFRLRQLLRGRRGTEAAIHGHRAGERFIVIDPARMLAYDPPTDALRRDLRFLATGIGDADAVPIAIGVGGAALRPLSPVRLTAHRTPDGVGFRWVRRSRSGCGWHDFVDAPLGETAEAYTIAIRRGGRDVRQQVVSQPAFFYAATDIDADGGGTTIGFKVAQNSIIVGPGATASITINLDDLEIDA